MPVKPIARFYKLVFAALVAGCLIFHLAILWESRHKIAAGYGDFIIFYTGAQIVADGRPRDLFNVETQNAYQAKFDVPQLEWPLPFNHAPYELFLFLPLVHLSFPAAHAVWSVANLLLLCVMLRWLLAYAVSAHKFFIAAAVFAWFPTMETFRLGQDSVLSAALLLGVLAALKRDREGLAGFLLALGLYKPQLVLPMAGLFLAARLRRALTVFAISGGVLFVVSVAMVGVAGAFDLLSVLRSMGDYSFIIYPRNMPNVRGLFAVILHPGVLAGTITIVISLALYALCFCLWRGKGDAADAAFDLKFALAIVATALIGFHVYVHDLFPVALSLILLFRHIESGCAAHTAASLFYFLLLIFFVPVLPRYLIEAKFLGWGALPILALFALLVAEIIRYPQKETVRITGAG